MTAVAAYAERWQARLEDVQWLHEQGESADEICRRLNVTPLALYRQLLRRGQSSLARRLGLARYQIQQPHGCRGRCCRNRRAA